MKSIHPLLQGHLDSKTTTLCFLLKIVPKNAAAFGVTSLDVDVDYDDGGGSLIYSSVIGLNQNAVESSSELSVDNSEAMLLITTDFTKNQIEAGLLDYADFFLYRINWADHSMGHYIVQSGTTGAVRADDELSGIIELRGLPQQLKQNYLDVYSITCRARFGSQVGEEDFPCNFDAEALWQNNTVDEVGQDPDFEFIADITPSATGPNGALPFDFAVIQFLTGNNAGLSVETDTVDTGTKTIILRFNAPYPIEVGDTFKMRPDCEKRFAEDCIALYDNLPNFRGEPLIPITEEAPSATPGANVPGFGAPLVLRVEE